MTNLYELLGYVLNKYDKPTTGFGAKNNEPGQLVHITPQQAEWIRNYMTEPETQINFKARETGRNKAGEPIMALDFQIAGHNVDVFSLLCEAMLQNANFASLVVQAARFFFEHLPFCEPCKKQYQAAQTGRHTWMMIPHKNPENGK